MVMVMVNQSLHRTSLIVQHKIISAQRVYSEIMPEWVQMAGRGIGFMCQWSQLCVSPSACVPMGREVRWEKAGGEKLHGQRGRMVCRV